MHDVFLPDPFGDPDMLAAILGAEAETLDLVAATAPGFALMADPHGARVALLRAAGAAASGRIARKPGREAAARLRFAMAAFGGWRGPVHVPTSGGPAEAMLASPETAPADPWPAAPAARWRAHLAEAATEIMSLHGKREAEDILPLLHGISFRAHSRAEGAAGTAAVVHRRGFGADEVETLELDRPYAQYFAVEEYRLRHRRFDGEMTKPLARAVWASGDAVTVLPFDPVRRRVLVIEQFRSGPFARRDPCPWCLEPIAGRCDAGETAEETARREALEEAALDLGRIERIGGYYSSPGTIAEHLTSFVAEADLSAAGGLHGLAEEDEDIRVVVLDLEEALEMIGTGEVNNGPLLISLLWLRSEADRLIREWTPAAAV